jgi:hypothetical protein
MAADPNPALRTELTTARDALAPLIRGLSNLADLSSESSDLHQRIIEMIASCTRRRDLINVVLHRLDQVVDARALLEADGYPGTISISLDAGLHQELEGEVIDIRAALALFVEVTQVDPNAPVALGLDVANVTSVPQPVPVKPGP